jgi:ribosomal protein S18 acetylase RimI-like enzyme
MRRSRLLRALMVEQVLARLGFCLRWRAGMCLDLQQLTERPRLPPGYLLLNWDDARLPEVARVDHAAYRNSVDACLYRHYLSSPAGCERMWREAMSGRFGEFDRRRTLLLAYEEQVCGDVMASTRGLADAFIGNLAVLPEHRGGIGKSLLLECLWRYREAGFQRVGLAVTLANEPAVRLYRNLGFTMNGRFPQVTWAAPDASTGS